MSVDSSSKITDIVLTVYLLYVNYGIQRMMLSCIFPIVFLKKKDFLLIHLRKIMYDRG